MSDKSQKVAQKLAYVVKKLYLCGVKGNKQQNLETNMQAATMTQGVYLNIPRTDWMLFQELVNRFGWQSETREQMLDEFMQTRPQSVDLSEEDIMNEVRSVRYSR